MATICTMFDDIKKTGDCTRKIDKTLTFSEIKDFFLPLPALRTDNHLVLTIRLRQSNIFTIFNTGCPKRTMHITLLTFSFQKLFTLEYIDKLRKHCQNKMKKCKRRNNKSQVKSVKLGKTSDLNLYVFSFPPRDRVKCGGLG